MLFTREFASCLVVPWMHVKIYFIMSWHLSLWAADTPPPALSLTHPFHSREAVSNIL